VTHHTSLSGVIYQRALVFVCINQHTKFEVRSFIDSKNMIGAKFKKGHVTPDHDH